MLSLHTWSVDRNLDWLDLLGGEEPMSLLYWATICVAV